MIQLVEKLEITKHYILDHKEKCISNGVVEGIIQNNHTSFLTHYKSKNDTTSPKYKEEPKSPIIFGTYKVQTTFTLRHQTCYVWLANLLGGCLWIVSILHKWQRGICACECTSHSYMSKTCACKVN